MTLESAWIYEIYHFQGKFVSIYRKEVKIIALTYFLATLPILVTKIAITRYLVIVKNSNWIMPKIPGRIHMYDMVKIDPIVFEIVGWGGGLIKPPLGSLTV